MASNAKTTAGVARPRPRQRQRAWRPGGRSGAAPVLGDPDHRMVTTLSVTVLPPFVAVTSRPPRVPPGSGHVDT